MLPVELIDSLGMGNWNVAVVGVKAQNREEIQTWDVPSSFLRPAVRRGRTLCDVRFTTSDREAALKTGDAGYLLHIESDSVLPAALRKYLALGEEDGVSKACRCRTRAPWYRVTHVHLPHAVLQQRLEAAYRVQRQLFFPVNDKAVRPGWPRHGARGCRQPAHPG